MDSIRSELARKSTRAISMTHRDRERRWRSRRRRRSKIVRLLEEDR